MVLSTEAASSVSAWPMSLESIYTPCLSSIRSRHSNISRGDAGANLLLAQNLAARGASLTSLVTTGLMEADDFLQHSCPGPAVPVAAWPKLVVLSLSNYLVPSDDIEAQVEPILTAAAKAASSMPSLRRMYLFNWKEGKLGLLTYAQRLDSTATIRWQSYWQYSLSKGVKEAWIQSAKHRRVTLSFEEQIRVL